MKGLLIYHKDKKFILNLVNLIDKYQTNFELLAENNRIGTEKVKLNLGPCKLIDFTNICSAPCWYFIYRGIPPNIPPYQIWRYIRLTQIAFLPTRPLHCGPKGKSIIRFLYEYAVHCIDRVVSNDYRRHAIFLVSGFASNLRTVINLMEDSRVTRRLFTEE